MKISYTLEEVKNILSDFTCKKTGGRPTEVTFIHRLQGAGDIDVQEVTPINRVELLFED